MESGNSDFTQNFMQNVKDDAAKQQAEQRNMDVAHDRKMKIGIIAVVIVIVAMAVAVVVLLIKRNNNKPSENPTGAEIEESDADEGSAREQNEDGEEVAVRMRCDGNDFRYELFKDSTYEIFETKTGERIDDGNYVLKGKNISFNSSTKGKAKKATYEDSILEDGEESIKCEEIDDI